MKKILFFVIFACFSNLIFAQTVWKVTQSSITFKIKNAGLTVDGKLEGFEGKILFDLKNLTQSQIQGLVKVGTIQTGISGRDKHLKKTEYFDAEKYPNIEMVSKRFEMKNKGILVGIFDLSMKGKTKEISLPFEFKITDETAEIKAELNLNRRDYDIGGNSWVLSDEVKIFIKLNLKK